ncbi:MAG: hypothetical protein R3E39_17710 [Anaerolineae bacterium]
MKPEVTIARLAQLNNDIQRAYDALIHERFGKLTPRQRQRLNEISLSIDYVNRAVAEYEAAIAMIPETPLQDPRQRLLYATRTPLEMVQQCAYFLLIHHMRNNEKLNADQTEAIYLMERSGRRMIEEVERLWKALKAELRVSS